MHLVPKEVQVEKKETDYEKKQRIGFPSYSIENLMKELEVDVQWKHVRHIPSEEEKKEEDKKDDAKKDDDKKDESKKDDDKKESDKKDSEKKEDGDAKKDGEEKKEEPKEFHNEEFGDKNDKKKKWAIKFEIKESVKYKLVTPEKTYEGDISEKKEERKEFEDLWNELSEKGPANLYIFQNLYAKLAENHIDANTFWSLSEGDFKDVIGIESFGKKKRLM